MTGAIALLRHRRPSSELQVLTATASKAVDESLASISEDVASVEGYVEAWRELVRSRGEGGGGEGM